MNSHLRTGRLWRTGWALGFAAAAACAAPPVVKTVPWVASNPLIPHTTWTGKSVRLKGTCDQQGANLAWFWDFGDGSAVATGTVSNRFAIEASHAYTGASGTVFTARLTVTNTTTGETGNKAYYVVLQDKTLDVEVNAAIDEGLWYLHKSQRRFTSGAVDFGDWTSGDTYTTLSYYGVTAANLNAFLVNGHLEAGDATNPYVETVQRGMRRVFEFLTTRTIGLQNPGSRNPDSNGNGYGVWVNQSYPYYQGGMFVDVIVATGTPNAITTTGPLPSGGNPGIRGRMYKDIVQDMVDDHAYAQYDDLNYGGWRYNTNDFPDNSACQWAAIGLIAAERSWGCVIPAWVKSSNLNWLAYSQSRTSNKGAFGYTQADYFPWGAFASTPSGMVQMILDGVGRGMKATNPPAAADEWPNWDWAETYMRDRFHTGSGPTGNVKDYYYGLFSFVKSMLLHQPAPIVLLQSMTAGVPPIDWYAAEVSKGAPTDGVARTLVGDQNPAGFWWEHNYEGNQYRFETAWAIMMLHKTLFESGVPVAVAKAVPNPAVAGQPITLDGSDSYHQDASKSIVLWEWDLNSDGIFDAAGPFVSTSFPAIGTYPVRLRVTDDNSPPKVVETSVSVLVTIPPLAPTADANGPYVFCAEAKPWFLDGRKSVNPDEGRSEPHVPAYPGDTIQKYEWDLNNDGVFDVTGPTPDVTDFFTAAGPGSHLIRLRVTDTTSASFPSSGSPDLTSIAFGQVVVPAQACLCVTLTASPLLKDVKLAWTEYAGMHHYNVYRSTVSGGPYLLAGSVPATAPREFIDHPGILNQVYHYVVRPAAANDDEICQSNQASAEPLHPIPTVGAVPTAVSNTAKYYYTLKAASDCFGRNQLQIWIADTASSQVAGPFATEWLVYIRTRLATPSVRAGAGTVKGYVMTKGSARIWAVDPIGQKSLEVVIP